MINILIHFNTFQLNGADVIMTLHIENANRISKGQRVEWIVNYKGMIR